MSDNMRKIGPYERKRGEKLALITCFLHNLKSFRIFMAFCMHVSVETFQSKILCAQKNSIKKSETMLVEENKQSSH